MLNNGTAGFFKKRSVKDYLSVLSSRIGLQFINIIRGLVVAKVLGPAHYGILKGAELITMLDKYGNLGFKSVATREIPHLRGTNDKEKENEVRDNAYSSEIVLSVILLLAGMCSSFFFKSKLLIFVVLLASVRLFSSKISGILDTEAVIEKKFVLFSKIIFWTGFFSTILVILTVPFWGIYSVLIVPIFISVIIIYWYLKKLDYSFRFRIKKQELFRQLRIGIPLALGTLAYGSYRYSERIIVISILGLKYLGFYGLATMIMNQLLTILLTALQVRKIGIFERLGQKKYREVHHQVIRETLMLILGAVVLIPISWIIIDIVIPRFLPQYIEAATICKILILAVPIRILASYSNLVIISTVVNKQSIMPLLRLLSLIFFVVSVIVLKQVDKASLLNIVIADIIGYAIFQLSCVFVYWKFFVKVYLER